MADIQVGYDTPYGVEEPGSNFPGQQETNPVVQEN